MRMLMEEAAGWEDLYVEIESDFALPWAASLQCEAVGAKLRSGCAV